MHRSVCDKAVILARGMGNRMRAADDAASLAPEQAAVADAGVKAMIPVGRPFLDYVLSGLADAGFREVCIVVAPDHDVISKRYTRDVVPSRVKLAFAVQERAIGTADAVLAAQEFLRDDPFVVLNADNYYPTDVLRQLRETDGLAGVAFTRAGLVRDGAIPADRIAAYAFLDVETNGTLRRIVEKPNESTIATIDQNAPVSMNCWRLDSRMFRACREVPLSARGEHELPNAIQYAIETLGLRFTMIPAHASVLDLSRRADIPTVAERLRGVSVEL